MPERGGHDRGPIRSVLAQHHPRLEDVVVDGASTDGTQEVLARYPHLRVVSGPDNGLYDALNKGIGMAAGEIVACLFSRSLLERVGTFDPSYRIGGDKGFLLRLAIHGPASGLPGASSYRAAIPKTLAKPSDRLYACGSDDPLPRTPSPQRRASPASKWPVEAAAPDEGMDAPSKSPAWDARPHPLGKRCTLSTGAWTRFVEVQSVAPRPQTPTGPAPVYISVDSTMAPRVTFQMA